MSTRKKCRPVDGRHKISKVRYIIKICEYVMEVTELIKYAIFATAINYQ